MTSLSTANLKALVRAGDFPRPRLLSARRVAWLTREVEAWCEARPVAHLPPPVNAGQRKGS
ncbi:helix-turn-helix transcriptional regulator [Paraburkholderia sediminicola]|uniref:helix-turn-helix transcriptional regulator n=1 Tax=Paraburkholderia sediminicola TaxID=458836 RepID=UPI0038B76BAE